MKEPIPFFSVGPESERGPLKFPLPPQENLVSTPAGNPPPPVFLTGLSNPLLRPKNRLCELARAYDGGESGRKSVQRCDGFGAQVLHAYHQKTGFDYNKNDQRAVSEVKNAHLRMPDVKMQ